MANPSKNKGTAAESAVVRYLTEHKVLAKREILHGNSDHGDVHVHTKKGLVVLEVKSYKAWASANLIEKWLVEADVEGVNAGADASALVVKRPGSGAANAGDWLVYVRADEWEWLAYDRDATPTNRWVCVNLEHFTHVLKGAS